MCSWCKDPRVTNQLCYRWSKRAYRFWHHGRTQPLLLSRPLAGFQSARCPKIDDVTLSGWETGWYKLAENWVHQAPRERSLCLGTSFVMRLKGEAWRETHPEDVQRVMAKKNVLKILKIPEIWNSEKKNENLEFWIFRFFLEIWKFCNSKSKGRPGPAGQSSITLQQWPAKRNRCFQIVASNPCLNHRDDTYTGT